MNGTTVEEHGDLIILTIYETITIHSIAKLEKIWDELLEKGPRVLAINCSQVDRIDSIGLSHLVKMSRNAIIREIELLLYALNPAILDLFKVARLETFFNILSEAEFTEKYLPL